MRRPDGANPAAPAKPPSLPTPAAAPSYIVPSYVPPEPAAPALPASAPSSFAAPVYSPLPYAPTAPLSPSTVDRPSRNDGPAAVLAAKAAPPRGSGQRRFGLSSDVGVPDGLNVGLVVAPADWMRLGASIGTNSAGLDYRGGVSLLPMGWGPSFSLEVGHCNLAATSSVIRKIFSVTSWVQPYVQQLGYTYVNAHVGVYDVVTTPQVPGLPYEYRSRVYTGDAAVVWRELTSPAHGLVHVIETPEEYRRRVIGANPAA